MSIYTSISGVKGHDDWMGVIGSNISNSSTIGYKCYDTQFADYLYSNSVGMPVGLGGGITTTVRDTSNGTLIETGSPMHIAISGDGYIKVTDMYDNERYTRAGLFNFDSNGVYVDPLGNTVMGIPINNDGMATGMTQPITLASATEIAPKSSTKVSLSLNLGELKEASTQSLFDNWHYGLQEENYAYKVDCSIYTPSGEKQKLNIFFDGKPANGAGSRCEYLIALSEESLDTSSSAKNGILMTGELTFNERGTVTGMSSLVPSDTPDIVGTWQAASLDKAGYPIVHIPTKSGLQQIGIDFGITGTGYTNTNATDPYDRYRLNDISIKDNTITNYAGGVHINTIQTDGSQRGFLQDVAWTQSGILQARYSNGESKNLYQLELYTFQATDALEDCGNGLYKYKDSMGDILRNKPGTGNAGVIQGGYLEQSNVDLAEELTAMLLCQSALSANTKMLSTMDSMVQTAIQLNR